VHTLLLRRGGRAVPAAVSPLSSPVVSSQRYTHHSNHLIQHLGLPVGVAVAVSLFPSRKVVTFGKRSRAPNRQLRRLARLGAVISHRQLPRAHEPSIDSPTTQSYSRNGRPILCCPRCASIYFFCCEEAECLCLPAMERDSSDAPAIHGVCTMYAF
jgi:hypothetical protein